MKAQSADFLSRIARAAGWKKLDASTPQGRQQLISPIFMAMLGLATLSLIPSLYESLRLGDYRTAVVHGGAYSLLALAAFGRRLGGDIRVCMGLGAVMLVGLYNLASFGLVSSGRIYLFTAPVLGGIFLGARFVVAMTTFNVLAIAGLGILMHTGIVDCPSTNLDAPMIWVITGTTFLSLSTLVALCVTLVIRSLDKQLAEQRLSEERIRRMLREKEVLLREVHHRVKNNLQVVVSLLHLQANRAKEPHDAALIMENRARIASMASVHEHLYGQNDLSHIGTRNYLKGLCSDVIRSIGGAPVRPSCSVEGEDIALDINTAMPFGLLVTELMINACKHAFTNGQQGQISVHLSSMGSKAKLDFADNGTGLPPDLDVQTSETLGFSIILALVDQLQGELRVNDSAEGASFTIEFPLSAQPLSGQQTLL